MRRLSKKHALYPENLELLFSTSKPHILIDLGIRCFKECSITRRKRAWKITPPLTANFWGYTQVELIFLWVHLKVSNQIHFRRRHTLRPSKVPP